MVFAMLREINVKNTVREEGSVSCSALLPSGGSRVLWVIHVDPRGQHDPSFRCKHVNFVSSSHLPGESEYLFAAYSTFTVLSTHWGEGGTPSRVELEAASDNLVEREDLPLAPWY